MLYIFDKDGTICESKSGQKFINSVDDQRLKCGMRPRIEALHSEGHTLAVASNQGGVAWGIMSLADAEGIVAHAAKLIDAAAWRCCPYHPKGKLPKFAIDADCRKPKPGMLLDLMSELEFEKGHTIFIGDRPEDEAAAEAAGVRFMWASDFMASRCAHCGRERDEDSPPGAFCSAECWQAHQIPGMD